MIDSAYLGALIETMFGGLTLGALYLLVSMGLTVIWGTLKIFSFAHGSFILIGAYGTWALLAMLGVNFLLAALITIVIGFILGMVLERTVISPLLREGLMPIIIGTLAVSILTSNAVLVGFGPRLKRLPEFMAGTQLYQYISVANKDIIILITSIGLLIAIAIFMKKTKIGLAMRAVEQDEMASRLMGISISKIYILVVGIACCLAAIAGIFIGSKQLITPDMGDWPITKSFIVVVFGGLGSIKGTIIAAFIVAEIEVLAGFFLGIYWVTPSLFILMMLGLMIKPSGLFGQA